MRISLKYHLSKQFNELNIEEDLTTIKELHTSYDIKPRRWKYRPYPSAEWLATIGTKGNREPRAKFK